MRIISQTETALTAQESGSAGRAIGIVAAIAGLVLVVITLMGLAHLLWWVGLIPTAFGIFLLLFSRTTHFVADKASRTVSISQSSFAKKWSGQYSFDQVTGLRLASRLNQPAYNPNNPNDAAARPQIELSLYLTLADGSEVQLAGESRPMVAPGTISFGAASGGIEALGQAIASFLEVQYNQQSLPIPLMPTIQL